MRTIPSLLPVLAAVLAAACSAEPPTHHEENDATTTSEALTATGPDLTVAALTGPASSTGGPIIATATVCNKGTQPAYGMTIDVRLSTDTTITAADPLIGNAWVNPLDPGACGTVSVNGYLPSVPNGAYWLGAIVDPTNAVAESNETNNTKVGSQIGIGNGPDLVVTAATTSPSVNGAFAVATTVCNQGTAPSGPSAVEIHFSTDTVITAADALAGSAGIQPIYPGQCTSMTVNGNAYAPPGAYFLGAIVDPQNTVPELIETNDTFTGKLTGVGPGPDLFVSSVTAPASIVGGAFTASAVVCNQGTQPSTSTTTLELRLSTDTIIDATDALAGTATVYDLAPGQCATETVNANAGSLPMGAYRIGAIVDRLNTVPELIESNDTNPGKVIGIGSAPDFVISGLTGPASIANDPVTVTATVCNQGTQPGSTSVEVHLSTDSTIATPDPIVGSANVPYLVPGQCSPITTTGAASYPLPTGAYYLGAIVDPASTVTELVETNNTYVGKLTGYGYGVDLIVSKVTGPTVITGQQGETATVTVCNQGSANVNGSILEVHLSSDTTITTSDSFAGEMGAPALMAGQCADVAIPIQLYPPFPMGPTSTPLYLGAIVDPANSVPELVESNNALAGKLTGIGFGPDLLITAVTGPADIQGGPFTASVTACNQGNNPVSGADILLVLSPDTTITIDDTQAGFASTPAILAGQCTTISIQGNAWPTPPNNGPYYLGAIIDPRNNVPELIETNNTNPGRLVGIGYGPDLVVSAFTVPATVPYSGGIASATVCNQGTAATYGDFVVDVHASADATVTAADQPVGYMSVPTLAAGTCTPVTFSLSLFPMMGATYLAAIADPVGNMPELIETNNVSVVRKVTVQ